MTGPTHIAIALSCGIIGGASKPSLALMAAGAILSSEDTIPNSAQLSKVSP